MGDFAQLIGVFAQFWLKNLLACALPGEVDDIHSPSGSVERSAYAKYKNLFADHVRNRLPGFSRHRDTEEGQYIPIDRISGQQLRDLPFQPA
jgi:hypothetical protein